MKEFIRAASPRLLSKIWIIANELIYYWGMYSLEGAFQVIDSYIPEIYDFININEIKNRMQKLEKKEFNEKSNNEKPEIYKFLPLGFQSDINEDIPELITIRDTFQEAFISVPSGLEKTEAWLYPYALKAGVDSDLEALLYFKSKGETLVPPHELSETWRKKICSDIASGCLHSDDKKIIEKAKKNELSIIDIAEIFKHSITFPNFLQAYDNEEDFITTTFFRTMEWFQLNEYEPWADLYAQEISTVYQGGVDQVYSLYPLFYYCRSDLLLRKVSKFGLEALLYGICVGNIDPSKPWKRYWEEPGEERRNITYVDYIPTASIIVFAWQRINPTNINKEILDQALLLLFQTQLVSGAWPLTSNGTKGDILSTCLAMTALVVLKPVGYQRYVDKGKEWLLSQQNEVGCWHIQGGPAVMINILCLEAIKMAEGDYQITYTVQDHQINRELRTHSIGKTTDEYIILCEGNSKGTKNKNYDEKCYTKIFSIEFPNAVFCSVGSCKDIETDNNLLFEVIKKVNPYHNIIKLIDRDDRSAEEIEELKKQGILVLSLRTLESYLLEDEIIEKLCTVCNQPEKIDIIKAIKAEALKKSIERGNPSDDLKSAAGLFFTEAKKALGLTKCGSNTVTFLRDTMAPLVTQETNTYKKLRKDIFGI
jgi:hypothetical protein